MRQIYLYIFACLICALPLTAQETALSLPEAEPLLQDSLMPAEADSMPADSVFVLPYPQILADMPHVRVTQDSLVTLLMEEKTAGVERGEREIAGYRVQVYSSNHPKHGKSNALQIEQRVRELVDIPVYVIYATPSWKVRLGDFRTQEEAETFRDMFKQLMPDLADYTYIVRDMVKIRY